jgi:hypothetical protein
VSAWFFITTTSKQPKGDNTIGKSNVVGLTGRDKNRNSFTEILRTMGKHLFVQALQHQE